MIFNILFHCLFSIIFCNEDKVPSLVHLALQKVVSEDLLQHSDKPAIKDILARPDIRKQNYIYFTDEKRVEIELKEVQEHPAYKLYYVDYHTNDTKIWIQEEKKEPWTFKKILYSYGTHSKVALEFIPDSVDKLKFANKFPCFCCNDLQWNGAFSVSGKCITALRVPSKTNPVGITDDGANFVYFNNNKVHFLPLKYSQYIEFKNANEHRIPDYILDKFKNDDFYFFSDFKTIDFKRERPVFLNTLFCEDNPATMLSKVISINEETYQEQVEYLKFDFENNTYSKLSPKEIKCVEKMLIPRTLRSLNSPYKTITLDAHQRLELNILLYKYFGKGIILQQEIDQSVKALILNEPLSKNIPTKTICRQ